MADNRGRDGGFRGANRNTDRKPRGDKPGFGEKKFGEKKFGDKKPYGERKFGDKPSFGEKKFGDRKPAFGAPRAERKPRPVNLAPRRVALETLLDVSRSDAYASLALDKRLAQANLPRPRVRHPAGLRHTGKPDDARLAHRPVPRG